MQMFKTVFLVAPFLVFVPSISHAQGGNQLRSIHGNSPIGNDGVIVEEPFTYSGGGPYNGKLFTTTISVKAIRSGIPQKDADDFHDEVKQVLGGLYERLNKTGNLSCEKIRTKLGSDEEAGASLRKKVSDNPFLLLDSLRIACLSTPSSRREQFP